MTKSNGAKGGTEIVTTGRFAQHEDHVYLAHTARAFCTLCNGNTKETWAGRSVCSVRIAMCAQLCEVEEE